MYIHIQISPSDQVQLDVEFTNLDEDCGIPSYFLQTSQEKEFVHFYHTPLKKEIIKKLCFQKIGALWSGVVTAEWNTMYIHIHKSDSMVRIFLFALYRGLSLNLTRITGNPIVDLFRRAFINEVVSLTEKNTNTRQCRCWIAIRIAIFEVDRQ